MKSFVVTLGVIVGEFEKSTQYLIYAKSADLAEKGAIFVESHDPKDLVVDGEVYEDLGGDFCYSVGNVQELEEDVETLEFYMKSFYITEELLKQESNLMCF